MVGKEVHNMHEAAQSPAALRHDEGGGSGSGHDGTHHA